MRQDVLVTCHTNDLFSRADASPEGNSGRTRAVNGGETERGIERERQEQWRGNDGGSCRT